MWRLAVELGQLAHDQLYSSGITYLFLQYKDQRILPNSHLVTRVSFPPEAENMNANDRLHTRSLFTCTLSSTPAEQELVKAIRDFLFSNFDSDDAMLAGKCTGKD